MPIGLYMDEQFPLAITDQLRVLHVDVLATQDDWHRSASDSDLLSRASELGRIFVTQDADLLAESSSRNRSGGTFVGVIFAPQTGVTIGRVVEDLELIAKASETPEWINRVEYLPLK